MALNPEYFIKMRNFVVIKQFRGVEEFPVHVVA